MPVVLVFNEEKASEAWEWDDLEGARHHFPNTYVNMVIPGERFVYYRGVRRPGGAKGVIEFFGHGTVGQVWLDPRTEGFPAGKREWFCDLEGYETFPAPVSAKGETPTGYREGIPKNRLQNIRRISAHLFEDILSDGLGALAPDTFAAVLPAILKTADSIAPLTPPSESAKSLILPRAPSTLKSGAMPPSARPNSKRAKQIGDLAERLAIEFIKAEIPGAHGVRHVAFEGDKPGWDIEYFDAAKTLQRVEVKGTVAAAFPNFQLTAGELNAALKWGQTYWLFLIARCEGRSIITRINNPAAMLGSEWNAEPVAFRIWAN
jgi:hypothetical protein